jgi:Tfp pilus assembly protein PilF
MTTVDALRTAFGYFHSRQLGEAEALCRQVLAREPGEAGAVHLLGLIAHARGRGEEALELLRHSVRAAPAAADWRNNLGTVRAATGTGAAGAGRRRGA